MAEPCSSSSSDLIASDEGQLTQLLEQEQYPAVDDNGTLLANMEACFKAFDKDRWVVSSTFILETVFIAVQSLKYRPTGPDNRNSLPFFFSEPKMQNKIRLVHCLALANPTKRALNRTTKCHSCPTICGDIFVQQNVFVAIFSHLIVIRKIYKNVHGLLG